MQEVGLEPTIWRVGLFTIRNHSPVLPVRQLLRGDNGGRTRDLLSARQMLYQSELYPQKLIIGLMRFRQLLLSTVVVRVGLLSFPTLTPLPLLPMVRYR